MFHDKKCTEIRKIKLLETPPPQPKMIQMKTEHLI